MCGIAGYFQLKNLTPKPEIIRKITDCMPHRGPDADGFFTEGPIALGHRRLSIIDLSEKANQPIFDNTGRYVIIFNGEIYNYQEVKSKLSDYSFQTSGDTEVVLAAFIRWGSQALQYLKGMFTFAIWDKSNQELFIARDRLGVKPLYYYKDENFFLFASEIRSILASGLVKREICQEALTDYLYYQSFQSPQTIVRNIYELPAGNFMVLSNKSFHINAYWKLEEYEPLDAGTTIGTIQKRVRELLLQSVNRRMVSDVPVAAFLSGGIDSSAVVGLMAEISKAPETFNIAFDEKEFDESEYANLIAKKFNTRHHKVLVRPEVFLEELPNALNAMDSPSGDGVNTYVVSKEVRRQGIKVALSGVGGDELFAGYPIFKLWEKINNNSWFWNSPSIMRKALGGFYNSCDIRKQRIRQLLQMENCNISNVYPVLRQVNANATVTTLLKNPALLSQLQKTLIHKQEAIGKFPPYSQISISEYLGYTGQTLLKDTDQMSMANSLEVREPFFDHELIEYVLRIPDNFKKGDAPKSLLINSLNNLIPPEIYERPKKGFVFPWNNWLRNELKSYCEVRIHNLSQRDFIQQKAVLTYWDDFLHHRNAVGYSNILLLIALENYIELHELK